MEVKWRQHAGHEQRRKRMDNEGRRMQIGNKEAQFDVARGQLIPRSAWRATPLDLESRRAPPRPSARSSTEEDGGPEVGVQCCFSRTLGPFAMSAELLLSRVSQGSRQTSLRPHLQSRSSSRVWRTGCACKMRSCGEVLVFVQYGDVLSNMRTVIPDTTPSAPRPCSLPRCATASSVHTNFSASSARKP